MNNNLSLIKIFNLLDNHLCKNSDNQLIKISKNKYKLFSKKDIATITINEYPVFNSPKKITYHIEFLDNIDSVYRKYLRGVISEEHIGKEIKNLSKKITTNIL